MLAVRPERRADGADRVDLPVVGPVRQLDPLALAGEDDGVVADHVAAAQDGEADVAALAGTGIAVAERGRTASRSTPRPVAAARPRPSEVPDGASTLWRWCISRISMSKSGPRVRATCSTRTISRLTPRLILGAWTIGAYWEARLTASVCAGLRPVVPMT